MWSVQAFSSWPNFNHTPEFIFDLAKAAERGTLLHANSLLIKCSISLTCISLPLFFTHCPVNTHLVWKGKYHCTSDLLFYSFGFSCFGCVELPRNKFTLLVKSRPVKQEVGHTMILPFIKQVSILCKVIQSSFLSLTNKHTETLSSSLTPIYSTSLPGSHPVWPDWAIFESSRVQNFLQSSPIILKTFKATLKNIIFYVKTFVAPYWAIRYWKN